MKNSKNAYIGQFQQIFGVEEHRLVGGRGDGAYYAANLTFADYDLAAELGVSFENTLIDLTEPEAGETPAAPVENEIYPNESNAPTEFTMRVYGKMEIFAKYQLSIKSL